MAHAKKGAIAYYIVIALILGAITYIEFAIVEYPVPWLNSLWTLVTLAVLSLIKFALVVAIYMHLRDDDPMYTGFFSSGLIIAIGTFIALSALFTVRSVANLSADVEPAAIEHAEDDHSIDIEAFTEKSFIEATRTPAPKGQALELSLPLAEAPQFSLRGFPVAGMAQAQESSESSEESEEAQESSEAATDSAEVETVSSDFDWQALGDATYNANCIACHQANGQGIPAAFPPLAGHMPELYNAEGGRAYIINVVLYGLQGEIEANGEIYNGVMTPWNMLSDDEIAATLNHELTSWGNAEQLNDFAPILPDEVAALRGLGLSPADVHESRPLE